MTDKPNYVDGHKLLEGKTVLVTAAAGTGIGFSVAKRAAEEGCESLVISDIHERRLGEAADAIEKNTGLRPETFLCNVTKGDEVEAMFAFAADKMGHVDVLMNNAGLGGFAKLVDMTDEQWSSVLTVTLDGTMRCTRAVMRHMIDAGIEGAIVNNASVVGWRAQAEQCHYAAAKAGVMALTRCAAIEAAEHGININAVAPSIAMHAFLEKVSDPGLLDDLAAGEAFGRAAEPWEVANVMVFLASDLSGYMTGEIVSVSSQHP